VRDGKLRWQTPLSQAFPPGFSTDNGWAFYRFPGRKVYAGSVYGNPDGAEGGARTRNLGTTVAAAGLSEDTGAVLWRDTGSTIGCFGTLDVAANPDDPDSPILPVRCRATGTATYHPDSRSNTFADLNITVEGFDSSTGKTTWTVAAGSAEALAGADVRPAVAGTTQVLVVTGSGPQVIDLANGGHRPPLAGEVFWCLADHEFDYHEPYPGGPGQPPIYPRQGGQLATACDTAGKPVTSALPAGAATAAVGANAGHVTVIATGDTFTAYTTR